jgi:hypothetical protein
MSASERLSQAVDQLYRDQSTASIKSAMRIIGLKGDSNALFIKSILDEAMNGMSGSFSFKFTQQTGVERQKDLMKISEAMHKETDYALTTAYEMLSDDDKKIGQKIAVQNAIRNALVGLMSSVADAATLVDNWLTVNNKLIIPEGAQLESTVLGGTRLYSAPKNKNGYKEKVDVNSPGEPTVWTKTSEIYGRKRVPLKGDASITTAFELLADYAKTWEDFWNANALPKDDNDLIDKVLEWTTTLKHQDHVIVTNKLDDADLIKCKKTAEEYYKQMMKVR